MENLKKPVLSEEQLDALAQNLLPAMREFYSSERGKAIWEEHLREVEQGTDSAA